MASVPPGPAATPAGVPISQVAALIGATILAVLALSPLSGGDALPLASRLWLVLCGTGGILAFATTALMGTAGRVLSLRALLRAVRWFATGALVALAGWALWSVGPALLCADALVIWEATRQDRADGRRMAMGMLTAGAGAAAVVLVLALAR